MRSDFTEDIWGNVDSFWEVYHGASDAILESQVLFED